MNPPVRAADDTSLFVLDDHGVFFSEGAQEIHLFNPPATFLWCCLERGLTLRELVVAYAGMFRLSEDDARIRVTRTLDDWSARGFLERSGRRVVSPGKPPQRVEPAAASRAEPPSAARSARVRLLDTRFHLLLESVEHERWVWPVVAHLESVDTVAPDVRLEVMSEGGAHVIRRDGVEQARCSRIEELAPAVKAQLWEVAVNRHTYLMEIHAAVVFDGRACTLLPAAPGGGKTTLTAGLIRAGFAYLSDEAALLDAGTLRVRALPLALTIKQGAVDDLSRHYPQVPGLPVHRRADGVAVRYLAPPATSRLSMEDRSFAVDALVFPAYTEGARTRLSPISRPGALGRLLEQCLVLPGRLGTRDVQDLVRWMRGLTCLELTFSSLESAVELLAHRRRKAG